MFFIFLFLKFLDYFLPLLQNQVTDKSTDESKCHDIIGIYKLGSLLLRGPLEVPPPQLRRKFTCYRSWRTLSATLWVQYYNRFDWGTNTMLLADSNILLALLN